MTDELLTPKQLGARWGLTPSALESRRNRGKPPAFLRIGNGTHARVRYRLADILALEEATHTGEPHADRDP